MLNILTTITHAFNKTPNVRGT